LSKDAIELQEILEAHPVSGKQNNKGSNIEDIMDNLDRERPSEYSQWVVMPNKTYAATGGTTPHLPVGAYSIEVNPQGLFFVHKKIMTDALVDFGNSNSLRVIDGIKNFWKKKKKYLERSVVFKRGILMWGPPGSGKTATLALLVKDLIQQGGIVILVRDPAVAIVGLQRLRKIEPERPLILIFEDVEEIISTYGEHDLLGLLDGEHQTDNVVNIATTNYPEELGARIVNRPSRFDEVVKIGMPSSSMRLQYLRHVLGKDADDINIATWVEQTDGMSIAHLKELAVAVTCLDQPYAEVIARLKTMKTAPKSSSVEKVGFETRD